MKTMLNSVQAFIADESGVTAIEYGLIAALVGVAVAGTAKLLGDEIKTTFNNIVTSLKLALT
ncbi:Flp family type IVb pilin [Massilia litorea]|uniref:Flp family type IVb pilin n=1 Tax=Massilia litorea TaxID=2769491 RepID=A0A7L9U804_9BURK|nr:Flp family type IVb pilin [Massilia litorea]QOL50987.1 Flp family type IVb pilin [Massilia litorea]